MNKIARDKGFDKTGFRIINNCGHDEDKRLNIFIIMY